VDLAKRHAALRAARRLFRRFRAQILLVDFLKVARPGRGRSLFRAFLDGIDEFQQTFRHGIPFWAALNRPFSPRLRGKNTYYGITIDLYF
jgi:hypothetical protein